MRLVALPTVTLSSVPSNFPAPLPHPRVGAERGPLFAVPLFPLPDASVQSPSMCQRPTRSRPSLYILFTSSIASARL